MEEEKVELNIKPPATEWTVYRDKTFTVTVRCWNREMPEGWDEKWNWNVYANIFEEHPCFGEVERLVETLHMHGGCTYEKLHTIDEARGNRYEWQRSSKMLKIGSDYVHYGDDYFESSRPSDGIPYDVQEDCKILVAQLKNMVHA